jgi:hypoxanthine phosphoribosyltransferase
MDGTQLHGRTTSFRKRVKTVVKRLPQPHKMVLPPFTTTSVVGKKAERISLDSNGASRSVYKIISETLLNERIRAFSEQVLAPILDDGDVTMVPLLNGAMRFYNELSRYIVDGSTVELMALPTRSYGVERTSGGVVVGDNAIVADRIRGRTVMVLDDILDTGKTIAEVTRLIEVHEPRRIITVFLLRKLNAQTVPFDPDYCLFNVHRESWVFGFGMDLEEKYRHLSCVCDDNLQLYDRHGVPHY